MPAPAGLSSLLCVARRPGQCWRWRYHPPRRPGGAWLVAAITYGMAGEVAAGAAVACIYTYNLTINAGDWRLNAWA